MHKKNIHLQTQRIVCIEALFDVSHTGNVAFAMGVSDVQTASMDMEELYSAINADGEGVTFAASDVCAMIFDTDFPTADEQIHAIWTGGGSSGIHQIVDHEVQTNVPMCLKIELADTGMGPVLR